MFCLMVVPDARNSCLDCLRSPAGTTKQFSVEFWRHVVQIPDVATRDHQHVALVHWPLIA